LLGEDFGYGYPMDGYPAGSATGYRDVRPSYELRILIASANILAQRGEQQLCKGELSTIRDVYKTYVVDMRGNGMPEMDRQSTQQKRIAPRSRSQRGPMPFVPTNCSARMCATRKTRL
jgi:hypothetical protein